MLLSTATYRELAPSVMLKVRPGGGGGGVMAWESICFPAGLLSH